MSFLYYILPLVFLAYLTWRHTHYGLYIILITVPGYLLRCQIWFVPTNWLELAIYVVFFSWLAKHLYSRSLRRHLIDCFHRTATYHRPIVLLLIGVIISTIISDNHIAALGILKSWFIAPLLFALVYIDTIKTPRDQQSMILALSLSVWPISLYGLFEYFTGLGMVIPGRLDSFFTSPNYVAMYTVPLFILIAGWLFVSRKHQLMSRSLTSYWLVWLGLTAVTIFLTKSFGGWLGLSGGLFILLTFLPRFNRKKAWLLSIAVVLLVLTSYAAIQKSTVHYDKFWQVNSLALRREIWINSFKLLARSPLLGVGLADFQTDYLAFINQLPLNRQPIEREVLRPHNVYLEFWLETGILGLIAFLWLILIFVDNSRHLYLANPRYSLAIPAVAAMSAILLHGFVDTPYFKNDLSLLFWFLIALHTTSCDQHQTQ